MLMRPLNGANAELTGRVSRAAARGVMVAVSAGNYTLSRCILAALAGERGAPSPPPGAPPPTAGLTARDTPLRPARPPNSSLSQKQGPGARPPMHTPVVCPAHRAHPLCSPPPRYSVPWEHTKIHVHTFVAHTYVCIQTRP